MRRSELVMELLMQFDKTKKVLFQSEDGSFRAIDYVSNENDMLLIQPKKENINASCTIGEMTDIDTEEWFEHANGLWLITTVLEGEMEDYSKLREITGAKELGDMVILLTKKYDSSEDIEQVKLVKLISNNDVAIAELEDSISNLLKESRFKDICLISK